MNTCGWTPDHVAAYWGWGYAQNELGQYAEAIADHNHTLLLEPNFTAARYNWIQAIRMKEIEQDNPPRHHLTGVGKS